MGPQKSFITQHFINGLKKKVRVIIPRLKNFTLLNLNYDIFHLVTSWLDTTLSLFIHTVDDSFGDFRTNACYLLARNNTAILYAGSHDTA